MDTILFQNKDYKIREIKLPYLGFVFISTTNLSDALLPDGSNYVSKEAEIIDERIYFFVEENEIELNEKDLIKLVIEQAV